MAIIINASTEGTKIPSDLYLDCANFGKILSDISKGVLPSGTGRPFPLFSAFDDQRTDPDNIPWETNGFEQLKL